MIGFGGACAFEAHTQNSMVGRATTRRNAVLRARALNRVASAFESFVSARHDLTGATSAKSPDRTPPVNNHEKLFAKQ